MSSGRTTSSSGHLVSSWEEFLGWLRGLAKQDIIHAPDSSERIRLFNAEEISSLPFPVKKSLDAFKCLFFPVRRNLGAPFISEIEPAKASKPLVILGLKACDLKALRVLDYVFLGGEEKEEGYEQARTSALIISFDCEEPGENCFCLGLGGSIYPEKGFDLNLSRLGSERVLIELGSKKGEEFLAGAGFGSASENDLNERDDRRREGERLFEARLKEEGLDFRGIDIKTLIEASTKDGFWEKFSERCVECGACNFICPSCHCFLLSDWEMREGVVRFQSWDSCQYPGFARVAGGANPRGFRYQRLRNRYEKKFVFLKERLGEYACTGCGRCIDACAGEIDIRMVLKELKNEKRI